MKTNQKKLAASSASILHHFLRDPSNKSISLTTFKATSISLLF